MAFYLSIAFIFVGWGYYELVQTNKQLKLQLKIAKSKLQLMQAAAKGSK